MNCVKKTESSEQRLRQELYLRVSSSLVLYGIYFRSVPEPEHSLLFPMGGGDVIKQCDWNCFSVQPTKYVSTWFARFALTRPGGAREATRRGKAQDGGEERPAQRQPERSSLGEVQARPGHKLFPRVNAFSIRGTYLKRLATNERCFVAAVCVM